MNFLAKLVVAGISLVAVGSAMAQPALDRVEGRLRRQNTPAAGQGAAAIPPAKEPGYLGVVADDRDDRGRGARILEVVAGGPAAKAGLQVGDLVTAINDQQVRDLDTMTQLLELRPSGAVVIMLVNRDGADRQVNVTLGDRPAADKRRLPQFGRQPEEVVPAPSAAQGAGAQGTGAATDSLLLRPSGPVLGIRTLPISAEAQQQFNLPNNVGALVSFVGAGSPAEKAGVPLGAAIVAVDGQNVDSPQTLSGIIRQSRPGRTVDLTCIIRGQEVHKRVVLAAAPAGGPVEARSRPATPDAGVASPPGFVPQGPSPLAPGQGPNLDLPPTSPDAARIEELERRVAELEQRIEQLEAQQNEK